MTGPRSGERGAAGPVTEPLALPLEGRRAPTLVGEPAPAVPAQRSGPALQAVPPLPDGPRRRSRGGLGVLAAAAVGSLVAVGLGVYGRLHEPADAAINLAGFSSGLAAKSWLATGAFVLALGQLWSVRVLYGRPGRRGRPAPRWVGGLHRWSGRAAVLLTVPVAVHCLYALGFQDATPRVLVHSLAGCALYGVFVTKMLVVARPQSPRWALPLCGGLLFTALTAVWLSSAVWFFSTSGLTF